MRLRKLAIAWAGAVAALALALPSVAQEHSARSALVIGISSYGAPEVPALPGVAFDVESARTLARAMGIPEARTTVLRDAQATKEAILDALERLAATAGEGSRVFVYFSGHGTRWFEPAQQGCREGLLAYDREPITDEEIARRTRRLGAVADKVLVMFDACHSDGVSSRQGRPRALAAAGLRPKFHARSAADAAACARPSNVVARGLLAESTRLGALRENFVQITSSRADEVSFDEPGKGGLATQGVRDCLLGRASDLDASGAVSIGEIERCAQAFVDRKLRPFGDLRPHHVTVTGNRNIVPVPGAAPPAVTLPPTPAPAGGPGLPALAPPAAAAVAPIAAPPLPPGPAPAPPDPSRAALATLRDIEAQSHPRRELDVTLARRALAIGRDTLALDVRSSHDGHVYVVMLGSDRRSFHLLFPNRLDTANAIRAHVPLALPRGDWHLQARGPAGTNHLLVLVTDSPRDLAVLGSTPGDAASPYAYALNDLHGRSTLIDFLTGRGVRGPSETFGARLFTVEEVP